jgi:predicted nucleic acid-binding protein
MRSRTLRSLDMERHPHEPLLTRVWELRENPTAYDAVYVALAEALGTTLPTCDRRIGRAPGMRGRLEVVGPA